MDKFTKVFEADMQNSIDNISECDTKKGKFKFVRQTDVEKLKKQALAAVPKKNVSESVLAEVKGRIAAKKIEEAGVVDAAKGLWAGFKKLKPIKQIGTMGRSIRGVAQAAPTEFNKLKNSLGTADALKQTVSSNAKFLGRQAVANPYGTAALAGGTGLTAWGLKKPKKVQEGAPFDFSKLKDKKGKGKDKGKDGKIPPQFAKGKGGDNQADGEVNPAQEALAKAKGKAKKKGGKKRLPPEFLKGKGEDKGGPSADAGKKELPAFFKKKGA